MKAQTLDYSQLDLSEIAGIIDEDWHTKIYYGAKPYLKALYSLRSVDDNYGADSAETIIIYFLANAQTWKGVIAKAIKKELKSRI